MGVSSDRHCLFVPTRDGGSRAQVMTDNSVGCSVGAATRDAMQANPPRHDKRGRSASIVDETWHRMRCLLRPPLRQVNANPITTSHMPIPVKWQKVHRIDLLQSSDSEASNPNTARSTPTPSSSRAVGLSVSSHPTSSVHRPAGRLHSDTTGQEAIPSRLETEPPDQR